MSHVAASRLAACRAHALRGLQPTSIEPNEAAEAYRRRVLAPMEGRVPAGELASVREALSGARTKEIATFDRFAGLLAADDAADSWGHVVFDTAPTGHTLLLLDATRVYHRDVLRNASPAPGARLWTPLVRRKAPDFTRALLVTLPETTPVSGAAALEVPQVARVRALAQRVAVAPWHPEP